MKTVYNSLFRNLIQFAGDIVEDLKELFARVEKLECAPLYSHALEAAITAREHLEIRLDLQLDRIKKLEQEPKYTHTTSALQSSLLSLSDRIEKLESTIDVAKDFGAKDIRCIKQVNNILTERVNHLQNQVSSLKARVDNSPFIQGAD